MIQIGDHKYTNRALSLFYGNKLSGKIPPLSSSRSLLLVLVGVAGGALPAFDFLSEFLPAPDFGGSFRFDRLFGFDDAGDLPLIGGYDYDLCSFSDKSYDVHDGRRLIRRRKKRRASRMYRIERVFCCCRGTSIFFARGSPEI